MLSEHLRPNYFLSLPLHTNAAFTSSVARLQQNFREARPSGFHPSIIIKSHCLHLTVGCLRLEDDGKATAASDHTLAKALSVLQECEPVVQSCLKDRQLNLHIKGLATFQENHSDKCQVLYAVPHDVEGQEGLLEGLCGERLQRA